MASTVTVLDVAKYILDKSGKAMSTMKLQKLCYYSQAWSLAWTGKPLFKEQFAAWANGPVCRDLYDRHRGKFSITAGALNAGDATKLSKDQQSVVNRVLAAYQPLSGLQLSALTHDELPWREARGGLPDGDRSETPIPVKSMKIFYTHLAKNPDATRVADVQWGDQPADAEWPV